MKKTYTKPEFTIIPPDSPKHKEILALLKEEIRQSDTKKAE